MISLLAPTDLFVIVNIRDKAGKPDPEEATVSPVQVSTKKVFQRKARTRTLCRKHSRKLTETCKFQPVQPCNYIEVDSEAEQRFPVHKFVLAAN